MKLIFLTLSLFAFAAQAKMKTFDLEGVDQDGQKCRLFVESYGFDREIEGRDKFYAIVRTSFAPEQKIVLVANPKVAGSMMSVDAEGRPTNELHLRGRGVGRGISLLNRATSYTVQATRAERCVNLRPVRVK